MAEIHTPDLCIIGGGASGLAAAEAARRLGASVIVVERGRSGGTALFSGALPSSALSAAAARAAAGSGDGAFGIVSEPPKINFRKVHDYVEHIVMGRAPMDSAARFMALGVQMFKGEGKFIDPRTLAVGDSHIRARRFVIATGAQSYLPDIPGLLAVPFFTTETIFDNTRKLTHLVVIGAGPHGLELAQSYRRLGSEVTVIESTTALSASDPELAEIALRRLREDGVVIREHTQIVAVQARALGIGVIVRQGDDNETLDASHILVATARLPQLAGLDLDKARIRTDKADATRLSLTAGLRTSNRRVFAIGDATGGRQQADIARHQARLVVDRALLGLPTRYDPANMARYTGIDPAIAEIGLTEPLARQRHKNHFSLLRLSYVENDAARAARQGIGVVKLLLGRRGRILGAGIVGAGAGELLALFAMARRHGLSASQLGGSTAPYPSLADLLNQLGEQFQSARQIAPVRRRLARLVRLLP